MLTKIFRLISLLMFLLFCVEAKAACMSEMLAQGPSVEVTARVTSMLGRANYVVDVVQPTGISAACLVFRSSSQSNALIAAFELELPGQLGVHVVTLNQDYLVVESGTANGSFLSEIFVVRNGKPTRVKSIGSVRPPNFVKRGDRDYVLTTDGVTGQEVRTLL